MVTKLIRNTGARQAPFSAFRHFILAFIGFSCAFVACGCVLFTCACSSETPREHIESVWEKHGNPEVNSAQEFWLEYRDPPQRPVEHWEFYYKHCTLDQHRLVSDAAEFQCTDPY